MNGTPDAFDAPQDYFDNFPFPRPFLLKKNCHQTTYFLSLFLKAFFNGEMKFKKHKSLPESLFDLKFNI